jgi:hypothetical protein
MGFSTYNEIINALSSGKAQAYGFYKKSPATGAAGQITRLWNGIGFPMPGSDPTPALQGYAPTKDTPGAFPIANATSPATLHLLNVGAVGTYQAVLYLYDRLWHVGGINLASNALQSFTGVTAPTRHSDGIGNQLLVEITVAAGSTTRDMTINYTNTADEAKSVIINIPASYAANRVLWVSLAAGDLGVKSVQSVQLPTAMSAGTANLVMFNAMDLIAVPFMAYIYTEKDLILQSANLPKLADGACLSLMWLASASGVAEFWGKTIMAEN